MSKKRLISTVMLEIVSNNEEAGNPIQLTPEKMTELLADDLGRSISVQQVYTAAGSTVRHKATYGRYLELSAGTYRMMVFENMNDSSQDDGEFTYVRIYRLLSGQHNFSHYSELAKELGVTKNQARTGLAKINRHSNLGIELDGERMMNVSHEEGTGKFIFIEPKASEPEYADDDELLVSSLNAELVLGSTNISDIRYYRGPRARVNIPKLGVPFRLIRSRQKLAGQFFRLENDITRVVVVWSSGDEKIEETFYIPKGWSLYMSPLD